MTWLGVLMAEITWLHQSHGSAQEPNVRTLELEAGAFVNEPGVANEHLKWLKRPLRIGDVIRIYIVDAE